MTEKRNGGFSSPGAGGRLAAGPGSKPELEPKSKGISLSLSPKLQCNPQRLEGEQAVPQPELGAGSRGGSGPSRAPEPEPRRAVSGITTSCGTAGVGSRLPGRILFGSANGSSRPGGFGWDDPS